jgi:hypothetical protein
VLGAPVRAPPPRARLAAGWDEFVVPGLGVRCVSDEPWVTGAETCELVMALDAVGDRDRALAVFGEVQHLRDPGGGYWTGWQYVNQAHFPAERSSWTAAAMILAADALSRTTPASGLFRDLPAAGCGGWAAAAGGGGGGAGGTGAGGAGGTGAYGAGNGATRGTAIADDVAPCGCPRSG